MKGFRFKRSQNELSDSALIQSYKQRGNTDAVGILYERYSHLVYGICYKYLRNEEHSKDAVLSIFEKLFVDLLKYEIANFGPWIHSVARNHCFAFQQKEKIYAPLDDATLMAEDNDGENDEVLQLEPYLFDALESLNEQQKICVKLFYLERKTYQEIADAEGYELTKVKSYIQNGKRNLKIYLSDKGKNEK